MDGRTKHDILREQLFNDHLLRLWRTGANYEQYRPEEDGDIDVSTVYHSTVHAADDAVGLS